MERLFILSIFLAACIGENNPHEWDHPTHPRAVLSDGTTDPVWTDMVDTARGKWSGPLIAMGCEDPFRSPDSNDVILIPETSWTESGKIGSTFSDKIIVMGTVEDMINNQAYETVLPHELGHALGLGHIVEPSDNPESVMHTPAVFTTPSLKDIENAAISIGCR